MERLNIAEKNHQDWFGGHYFSDQQYDPEFEEIVRKFLCGDVLVHGTLSNVQRALVMLTALTASQTWKPLSKYVLAALDMGAAPEEIKETLYQCAPYIGVEKVKCAFYTRGTLDLKMRELVTFCAICCLGGCEPQAKAHAGANLSVGNTREMLIEAITQCLPFIGFPRTLNAISCINEVTAEK